MKTDNVENLEQELRKTRQASLEATRKDDYLAVASLTVKAARINQDIMQLKDELAAELN